MLGQCGDFMQKLSTSSEALARFPVSQVLFSTAVVIIATLPSFRRSIGEVLIEGTCSHLQLHVQAMVPTSSSIVRQHQDGHGIDYVYWLLAFSLL